MLTIGKLAVAANVSPDTLRYYEREGLIAPAGRSASSYRLYDKESFGRLRFIKRAQSCGFTLMEIRELLSLRSRNDSCCGDVRSQAVEKKIQIEAKIRTMKAMSDALTRLIADCREEQQPIGECSILAAFEQAITPFGAKDPG